MLSSRVCPVNHAATDKVACESMKALEMIKLSLSELEWSEQTSPWLIIPLFRQLTNVQVASPLAGLAARLSVGSDRDNRDTPENHQRPAQPQTELHS